MQLPITNFSKKGFAYLGGLAILVIAISLSAFYMPLKQPEARLANDEEPANMKGMTERHNYWRKQLGIKPLTWSNELAAYAQKWADELAKRGCEMEHRPRTGSWAQKYGENIYWSWGMSNTAEAVVDNWAEEIQYFDYNADDWCVGGVCGHYTQIIWESTTQVGCAMAKCSDGAEIWVCNYNPPGNYMGEKPYKKK